MADFGFEFNPETIADDARDFDLIPDQEVVAQAIEAKMKVSDDNAKHTLELTWELLEGPNAKRRFWQNLKLVHPSTQSAEIDGRMLKKHAAAVGHTGVLRNTDPLLYKPVRIKIGMEKGTNGYKDKNVIKSYVAVGGAAQTQGQNQSTVGAATGAASRPWNNAAA